MFWLVSLLIVCIVFYCKAVKPLSFWRDLGVAHNRPLPVLGNFAAVFFQRKSFFDHIIKCYKQFPNERYFGLYQFFIPILIVKDLELIKKITVKDFEHFIDHNDVLPIDAEPLLGKSLFNLKGQRWREMRAALSPSFTSSKMKMMFTLITECAKDFTKYFETQNKKVLEVEMKDIFTRFTNDAIATVAFGLKCNSLEDRTNDFYIMAKRITSFNGLSLIVINFYFLLPKLAKFLRLKIFPRSTTKFFRTVIKETLRRREHKELFRQDMIQLLIEARKGQTNTEDLNVKEGNGKLTLTDEDITAQALIFLFGGFETSSNLMSFIAYELALNEDIQRKLQKEIDETLSSCNGTLTYEALHKMKYMDMVVSETLRKWPPVVIIDRLCVKDYVIEPHLTIKKGVLVQIPVVGIHRDPNYFPNPDVFDPERFSDENKDHIQPLSYLPFGSGPRICIASRFALMENKALMFYLLSKFTIVKIDKTPYPLTMKTNTFNVVPKGDFWLGLKSRKVE